MNNELALALEGPTPLEIPASEEVSDYDEELDDVRSLLSDICEALADDERVKFVVEFAGEIWSVDVGTDLLTVLEQLPDAHKDTSQPFDIDFYEQGLERTLHFQPNNGDFEVRCESRHPTWRAPKTVVRVSREHVTLTLTRLVTRFVELAKAARPNITRHPWFSAWEQEASGASPVSQG